jgi:thioredoxin reductase (NADPH)
MAEYLIQSLEAADNVVVRLDTQVVDGIGERRLRGLVLEERTTGQRERVPAAALFVEIGGEPHTDWLPAAVVRDERGFLLTGRNLRTSDGMAAWPLERLPLPLETSLPGVFAAGDVRRGAVRRVAAAAGDGAVAIRSVHEYRDELAAPERRMATPVLAAARGAR